MRIVRRLLLVALLVAIAYPSYLAFRIWWQSRHDEVHHADAIVVMGAAQYDGKPSPVLKARLDQAAYLYDQELAPVVIVTGGKQPGDEFTEAGVGRDYLSDHGVPRDRIYSEDEGRTTLESLEGVSDIARAHDINSALLVSDPLHSERIKRMASDLGFDETYASWASYERLNRSRATKFKELLHEVGALMTYEILGR
ncbi:MAG TPA: YdcF family protein [Actinomycetota bacterium]|nr:YdcF family protein [Actinomycetota bacterium]